MCLTAAVRKHDEEEEIFEGWEHVEEDNSRKRSIARLQERASKHGQPLRNPIPAGDGEQVGVEVDLTIDPIIRTNADK